MSNKPTVFNYKYYASALRLIEELEADNDRLWKENANLQIKCRILEGLREEADKEIERLRGVVADLCEHRE